MTETKTRKRPARVKIDPLDLQNFLTESMTVDPYWNDLYNPPETPNKRKYGKKNLEKH